MVPPKLRSEILDITRDAEREPLTARSLKTRLGTAGSEPDIEADRDACVSLVIEGELDVLADGTNRRYLPAEEP